MSSLFFREVNDVKIGEVDYKEKPDDYLKHTSLEIIANFIETKLKIKNFYFEVIMESTGIQEGELLDFFVIQNTDDDLLDVKNVRKYLLPIYTALADVKKSMYFCSSLFNDTNEDGYHVNTTTSKPNADTKKIVNGFVSKGRFENQTFVKCQAKNRYRGITDIVASFPTPFKKEESGGDWSVKASLEEGHSLFREYFLKENGEKPGTLLFAIPIIYANSGLDESVKGDYSGQGACFLFIVPDQADNALQQKQVDQAIREIAYMVKDMYGDYVYRAGKLQFERARLSSIKSAIAAIMSRNMSHNLGSHVLSYVKSNIQNAGLDDSYQRGIYYLIDYLQERQDYIATVSSEGLAFPSPVNYKEFIVDCLTPDTKAKRHEDNPVKNLLLDSIAASEEYTRDSIALSFGGVNENSFVKADDKLNKIRNIELNLPGGIVGRQAFMSIFENFLRNSAKHNKHKEGDNLTLDISLEESSLFSFLGDRSAEKDKDYYKITISDNKENAAKQLVARCNAKIGKDIITETGSPVEEDKGIAEMKISAAWLRGIKLEPGIDWGKIIQYESVRKGNLAVTFLVPRPKIALFITTQENIASEINSWSKIRFGYRACTPEKYLASDTHKTGYRFVVFDLTLNDDTTAEVREVAPFRMFPFDIAEYIEKTKKFSQEVLENLELDLYEKWLQCGVLKTRLENSVIGISDKLNSDKPDESEPAQKYHIQPEVAEKVLVCKTVEFTKEHIKENGISIIFRKHNDGTEQFKQFKNKIGQVELNNLIYIEGISGANSTDRIIRRERIDLHWYYRTLEYAFANIAVIDERLFKKWGGKSVSAFAMDIKKLIEDRIADKKERSKRSNELQKKYPAMPSQDARHMESWVSRGQEKHLSILCPKCNIDEGVEEILHKKGLYLYNISANTVGTTSLVNLDGDIALTLSRSEKGEIKSSDHDFRQNLDIVSIHHGIVEKMSRSLFGDSTYEEDKTKCHKTTLNAIAEVMQITRIVVHSGRSKPHDLPDTVPFVQYSSLERAFLDCKRTLTDLLFSVEPE